jgi:hypothetical protein
LAESLDFGRLLDEWFRERGKGKGMECECAVGVVVEWEDKGPLFRSLTPKRTTGGCDCGGAADEMRGGMFTRLLERGGRLLKADRNGGRIRWGE